MQLPSTESQTAPTDSSHASENGVPNITASCGNPERKPNVKSQNALSRTTCHSSHRPRCVGPKNATACAFGSIVRRFRDFNSPSYLHLSHNGRGPTARRPRRAPAWRIVNIEEKAVTKKKAPKPRHVTVVPEETFATLEDYVKFTHSRSLEWDKGKNPYAKADAWYRGVLSEKFVLIPSYYRFNPDIRDQLSEGELAEEFRRRSNRILAVTAPRDEWEWYVLMQHYEMPTRLLDWTESSIIALYFAVSDYKRT